MRISDWSSDVCSSDLRWSDDPYYPPPWWRRRLEHWTEARIVRHAAGLTTVSEPCAETYLARYGKPVAAIYNGHDSHDQAGDIIATGGRPDRGVLRITQSGRIYPQPIDPRPLVTPLTPSTDT